MSNRKKIYQILVVAFDDMIGLSRLPKTLKKSKCEVTLVSPPNLLVTKSKYISKHIITPNEVSETIEILKEHLVENSQKYDFVVVGDETLLKEFANYSGEDWLKKVIPVPDFEKLKIVNSKFKFIEEAQKLDLQVPYAHLCRSLKEIKEYSEKIGFPLVIKEEVSTCGQGVRIVKSEKDLEKFYYQLKASTEILIQEFVEGRVGTTEVFFHNGVPICWFSAYSLVCLPSVTGMSCMREIGDFPEIENLLKGVGKLTGFTGFGGIDWVLDSKDTYLKLIEFNPRPTPGYHFGKIAKVNFSEALRQTLENQEFQVQRPHLPPRTKDRFLYLFPQDVHRIITDRKIKKLLRWIPFKNTSKDLPLDDFGLLTTHFWRIFKLGYSILKK